MPDYILKVWFRVLLCSASQASRGRLSPGSHVLNEVVYIANLNVVVSVGPHEVVVDFRNDKLGLLYMPALVPQRLTETAEPLFIWWRHLGQQNVGIGDLLHLERDH